MDYNYGRGYDALALPMCSLCAVPIAASKDAGGVMQPKIRLIWTSEMQIPPCSSNRDILGEPQSQSTTTLVLSNSAFHLLPCDKVRKYKGGQN